MRMLVSSFALALLAVVVSGCAQDRCAPRGCNPYAANIAPAPAADSLTPTTSVDNYAGGSWDQPGRTAPTPASAPARRPMLHRSTGYAQ